ncbi:MAG: metal-dependent transcriptional regulator [Oscillospiraceae bacterium]|nr:metal-dependent transcriptional regulator [Oscillospiraceae bacterium]
MKIQESAENYLETIYILAERNGYVRSIDVATELGFSKPSVSRAMKLLRENNYITVKNDGTIFLTPAGQEIAARIYERHAFLTQFLIKLGVAEDVAKEDACRIEHVISEETFSKLKDFSQGT